MVNIFDLDDDNLQYYDKMLTTVDNPYSPVDNFDNWLNYDITNGHNTCGLIDSLFTSMFGEDADIDDPYQYCEVVKKILDLLPEQYIIVDSD